MAKFFPSDRGSFLMLSAGGHAGRPRVHTALVWAPAEVRSAYSGRLKSRNPASNPGIVFRRAIANKAHGKPIISSRVGNACCCISGSSVSVSAAAVRLGHGPYSRLSRCTPRTGHGAYCRSPSVWLHSKPIPSWQALCVRHANMETSQGHP